MKTTKLKLEQMLGRLHLFPGGCVGKIIQHCDQFVALNKDEEALQEEALSISQYRPNCFYRVAYINHDLCKQQQDRLYRKLFSQYRSESTDDVETFQSCTFQILATGQVRISNR